MPFSERESYSLILKREERMGEYFYSALAEAIFLSELNSAPVLNKGERRHRGTGEGLNIISNLLKIVYY